VVTLRKVDQAFADLILSGARSYTEKGVGEITTVVVDLRWEIIRFRLAFLTDFGGVLIVVVNMMGQRSHVIKKLGIHRPTFILFPEPLTDYGAFELVHYISKSHHFGLSPVFHDDHTQPFIISGKRAILCRSGRRKPPFIDPTALTAQYIIIIRMQLDATTRHAKGPGYPGRCQSQNTFSLIQGSFCQFNFTHFNILVLKLFG